MSDRLSDRRWWVYVDGVFLFGSDNRHDIETVSRCMDGSRVSVLDSEAPLLFRLDGVLQASEVIVP